MTKSKTLRHIKTPIKTTEQNQKNKDLDTFGILMIIALIIPIIPP
jgi:uncharacterized protein YqeY